MKISFVIPAYNESRQIGACLKSIKNEIEAFRSDDPSLQIEIIVVNNASTDKTRKKALAFKGVSVVDESLKGLVIARRTGFVVSTGELVANIDADVRLPPGWLATVMREFERDPNLVALSGPFVYDDISLPKRAMVRFFYWWAYLFYFINRFILKVGSMLQGGNFVVRRDALIAAGGYDTTISFYGEDTDIARRMHRVGNVTWTFRLPVYSTARRLKGEGIIATSARYTANYFWVTFFGRPFTTAYKDVRSK